MLSWTLMLTMLTGQVLGQAPLQVMDYVRPSRDCQQRCVGADCTQVCDLAPAFEHAQRRCRKTKWHQPGAPYRNVRVGCAYELPMIRACLSRTVVFNTQTRVVGQGGWGWGARTRLEVCDKRAPTTMFRFEGDAGWSEVLDLGLVGSYGRVAGATTPVYGIQAKRRISIRGVWVGGFTQGIRIEGARDQNSNLWHLERVRVDRSAHAGVYVGNYDHTKHGSNANAGLGVLVDTSVNCQAATHWAALLGPCAGVVDGSFLGNTWLANHAATNIERTLRAPDPPLLQPHPAYRVTFGNNARTLWLGPYAEGGQTASEAGYNGMVVGGLSNWNKTGGHGTVWQSFILNQLAIFNDRDPTNRVAIRLGTLSRGGAAYNVVSLDHATRHPMIGWAYNVRLNAWLMRVNSAPVWTRVAADGTGEVCWPQTEVCGP